MVKRCIAFLLCFLIFSSYAFLATPINKIEAVGDSQPVQESSDEGFDYEWVYEVIEVPETVGRIEQSFYKDGVMLVKGSEGKLYRTLDFKTWQEIEGFDYVSTLYNNDEFFFVVTYEGIFRSNDGLEWELCYPEYVRIDSVVYDGEKFIALSGYMGSEILHSNDGYTWYTCSTSVPKDIHFRRQCGSIEGSGG